MPLKQALQKNRSMKKKWVSVQKKLQSDVVENLKSEVKMREYGYSFKFK